MQRILTITVMVLVFVLCFSAPVSAVGIPPVADANGPYSGVVGESIQFDGSGSYDIDSGISAMLWDLDNDGQFLDATGLYPTWIWNIAGTYAIAVIVIDHEGNTDTDGATVTISEPVEVGGEVYPVDKLNILAPWVALAAVLIIGTAVVMRRRKVRC